MTEVVTLDLSPTNRVDLTLFETDGGGVTIAEAPDDPVELLLSPIFRGEQGDPGPKGDKGDTGAAGAAGGDADKTYLHRQSSASDVWGPIFHNLGKIPSVTVIDSGGTVCEGEPEFPDINSAIIRFAYPFGGEASFN